MPIRDGYPVRFTPRGLSDAYDATDTFPGACRDLKNLVFSRNNPEMIVPRPGVGDPITEFAGFTTPGFVSLHFSVQPRVYGMVETGATPTFDEPFCFDVQAGAFVAISGVTGLNVPTSPGTTGAWTPPKGAVIGSKIIITHPGFSGAGSNFFGVIDVATFASPAWSSANTATNPLPGVPSCVENFNNRAYYAVGNQLWFSDSLDPLTITSATQFLVVGDSSDIIAMVGLPVQTDSGGIVSSLLIFKAGGQIWQLRGDAALSNLELSFVSLNLGTLAPRTCVTGPEGTYFIGTDGPYLIDTLGGVFPLRSNQNVIGSDITAPFSNATTPSRNCAAFAGKVYRTCGDTVIDGVEMPGADYWFDANRRRWSGSHSFPYDCASPYDNDFILSSKSKPGALFRSEAFAGVGTTYLDDGAAYQCLMTTSLLPKTHEMTQKQVVESTVELGYVQTPSVGYNINALDQDDGTLGSFGIVAYIPAALWGGGSLWGGGVWSSGFAKPRVFNIEWNNPLVFQKVALQVGITATQGASVGTAFLRYQDANYTNSANP